MTAPFQDPNSIVFFLNTANQYLDSFSDDDLEMVCVTLKSVAIRLHEDPALHTDHVLDALHGMGVNSAYKDLGDHPYTPRQEACLRCVRMLARIARSPDEHVAQRAFGHLDNIITNSMDSALRGQVRSMMSVLMKDNARAVALLEKHGEQNSDTYIRQECREGLLNIARNHPDKPQLTERALAALIHGMDSDPAPENRVRSIALLTNRISSTTCSADELQGLRKIFERAVKDHAANEGVLYWAKIGVNEADERIRTQAPGRFKFP